MTSEKGKGFLTDGCFGNSDETVFATDGERLRLGGPFDAGDIVSGEYVFPSPNCRQPGYSRSVYRSACPGLGQTQVSAQAGLRRVETIVQKGQMTRRTVRFRRNVNFEKP